MLLGTELLKLPPDYEFVTQIPQFQDPFSVKEFQEFLQNQDAKTIYQKLCGRTPMEGGLFMAFQAIQHYTDSGKYGQVLLALISDGEVRAPF